ncbi:MAG TPA: hypothetical protein VL463_01235 [Kofleriaceae bacterium]|nr:hypothetical protein [Kofleriaceae bacterium]
MSEGAKKAEDKMNMVGVVVVGICGAVLVYVSIVLLEAFYMNETSEVNVMADYGGQDTDVKSVKASQIANITGYGKNAGSTFRISIDKAMDLVVDEGKNDASNLIPAVGKSEKPTIQPVFGRPQALGTPSGSGAPAPETPGSATPTPPPAGAGAGSGAAATPQPTTGNTPGANVAGTPTGPAPATNAGSGGGSGAAPVIAPVPPPARGSAAGSGSGSNGH